MSTKYEQYSAQDTIDKHLLDHDLHYLYGEMDDENVAYAIKWILAANITKKPRRTLRLYINTPGGSLYDMFALVDVIKKSYHPVSTIGIGQVMSAGFIILAAGQQGERYIGRNAGIMNHQHSDSMESKMHDIKAQMAENNNCEARCLNILREATGMSIQEVRKRFINNPTDQYYTAKDLLNFKIVDHIL